MINRAIYNLLMGNKELKNVVAKNGKEYCVFKGSKPDSCIYPCIVFNIKKFEIDTKVETNELVIDLYTKGRNRAFIYSLNNSIIDQLDKKILKHPNSINLRLYLASEIGFKTIDIDDINIIESRFLIRGNLSDWDCNDSNF